MLSSVAGATLKNIRMSPPAIYHATVDQDEFSSPEGWDFRIYSLEPREFWYSKTTLPVFDGLRIVRYDFRGRVRFRAAMEAPKLQINFIDSYSTVESRLQGRGKIESVVMITVDGNGWDGLTDVGALGIELNFDEALAAELLSPELLAILRKGIGGGRSTVAPVSTAAGPLKAAALRYLAIMDAREELRGLLVPGGRTAPLRIERGAAVEADREQAKRTILEMARNMLDEVSTGQLPGATVGSNGRREIALKVEKMLWQPPYLNDDDFDCTLEEFEEHLGVSRRTIQLAVQEQFGIGFVALRRLIRLTQVRQAILATEGRLNISKIAADHRLHFGRLSKEYYEMFGIRPSAEKAALLAAGVPSYDPELSRRRRAWDL